MGFRSTSGNRPEPRYRQVRRLASLYLNNNCILIYITSQRCLIKRLHYLKIVEPCFFFDFLTMLNLHKALFVAIEIPCMHLCMVKIQYSNEIFQLQFRVSPTQENDISTKLVNSVSFLMCVCVCLCV